MPNISATALRLVLLCLILLPLGACHTPPPPQRAELLEDGPYPNLSTVPPRPTLETPLAEREALHKSLLEHNAAATKELSTVNPDAAAQP